MVPVFRNIYLTLAKDSNSSQPIVIRFCLFLKKLNKSKGAGLRWNILSTYPSLRWFIITHYNCKVLTSAHPQFNGLTDHNRPCRKSLDSLSSLFDLSAFQLNSLHKDIDPDINFTSNKIRSKYCSPQSFAQFIASKQLQSKTPFYWISTSCFKWNEFPFYHYWCNRNSYMLSWM